MNIRAFIKASGWGVAIGVGVGTLSAGMWLTVGTIYASNSEAKISREVKVAAETARTAPPIVATPETTNDQQLARVIVELDKTKKDLKQTKATLKAVTDNISEHFISNYRDTITVVGTGLGIVAALLGGLIAWGYGLVKEGLTKKIKQETEAVHARMMEESKNKLSRSIYMNVSYAMYLYYRVLFSNTKHLGFNGGTDLAKWFAEGAVETAAKLEDSPERESLLLAAKLNLQYHVACKTLIPNSNIIKTEVVANTVRLYERLKQISDGTPDLDSMETMAWVFIICGTDAEKEKGKILLQTVLTNSDIKVSDVRELQENYRSIGFEVNISDDGSFHWREIPTIPQGEVSQS